MSLSLFPTKSQIKARAIFLGERIDLRALELTDRLGDSPITVRAGAQGCAVILRYGVVVLFNLDALEEVSFLNNIKPLVADAFPKSEIEDVLLNFDSDKEETTSSSGVVLNQASLERIQMVAQILAKSAVLAHYEYNVAEVFDRIEPLANNLQHQHGRWNKGKELMRHIGRTLLIHQKVIGRVEVGEKPDLLWDHPDLERLYGRLESEYEIKERQVALERKLELIFHTVETLFDILHVNRALRLEWYVVILIVIEILLTLYQMFISTHH